MKHNGYKKYNQLKPTNVCRIRKMNKWAIKNCLKPGVWLFVLIMITAIWYYPVFAQRTHNMPSFAVRNSLHQNQDKGIKVFGGIYRPESCSYDARRGLIVVPSRGEPESAQANDGWVSLLNHDGSLHTIRWIGSQIPDQRKSLSPSLMLNEPLGSDIMNDILYIADYISGTSKENASHAFIHEFDMNTGKLLKEILIKDAPWINDIAVTEDRTIYATQTGDMGPNPNPETWAVWKITPDGQTSIFVQGKPLNQPNGIAIDPDGNIVVVNTGNADVLTFSKNGKLLKTETAAQPGSDGIVILPNGTKYVSSVLHGGISRIRPGKLAELIAQDIPETASMCYDSGANQLVVPMASQSALVFIPIE